MTLDQYIEARKQELEAFQRYWLEHKGEPGWPDELEEGEWFEQEAAFGQFNERHD